jgi:APA family basic amino acid/polyamine antiporter
VGLCTYQLPVLTGLDLSVELLRLPFGMSLTGADTAALLLVPGLTLLNLKGAQPAVRTQTFLTVVPIVLLVLMSLYALSIQAPAITPSGASSAVKEGAATLGGLVTAYMAVYFAYSGWINIIYVAGEVIEPQRNIPRALIGGTVVITLLYLLLCGGFVRTLGFDALASSGEAGTATANALGGEVGKLAMTVLIASALLASLNATMLGGARVALAMGRRGAMWPQIGTVDEKYHVPDGALWVQAGISVLLILSGRFEQLYTMVSLAMVVTGSLTVGSVFVLRHKNPEAPRPYRATGYPWLPGIYVVASLAVIVVMLGEALSNKPGAWYPLLGLAMLVVVYFVHRLFLADRGANP